MNILDFLFSKEKLSPICPTFASHLTSSQLTSLKSQAYMSSQGVSFQCSTCDFYSDGYCQALKSPVQSNGCCNIWERDGVKG